MSSNTFGTIRDCCWISFHPVNSQFLSSLTIGKTLLVNFGNLGVMLCFKYLMYGVLRVSDKLGVNFSTSVYFCTEFVPNVIIGASSLH